MARQGKLTGKHIGFDPGSLAASDGPRVRPAAIALAVAALAIAWAGVGAGSRKAIVAPARPTAIFAAEDPFSNVHPPCELPNVPSSLQIRIRHRIFLPGVRQAIDISQRETRAGCAVKLHAGKILVAGWAGRSRVRLPSVDGGDPWPYRGDTFLVARYQENGQLDPTFGVGGLVHTNFPESTSERAYGITVDVGDRIVAAGAGIVNGGLQILVARYTADGKLDPDFGGSGMVVTNIAASPDEAGFAVTTDVINQTTVAGVAVIDGGARFAIARYSYRGNLVSYFGTQGVAYADFTSMPNEVAYGMVSDDSGRSILAGVAIDENGEHHVALARYDRLDGVLDKSFSEDGKVIADFGGFGSDAHGVALDGQGRIVVAGTGFYEGIGMQFGLARFKTDGSLDSSFDKDGKVATGFFDLSRGDHAAAVAVDAKGRIVAAGSMDLGEETHFALARYRDDGTLDSTFDGDGRLQTHVMPEGRGYDDAYAVAIDGSGRPVAVGATISKIALVRYLDDGRWDASFGADGKQITGVSPYPDGR